MRSQAVAKRADWIVANDVQGASWAGTRNRVHLVTPPASRLAEGSKDALPRSSSRVFPRNFMINIKSPLASRRGLPSRLCDAGAAGLDVVTAQDLSLGAGRADAVPTGFAIEFRRL